MEITKHGTVLCLLLIASLCVYFQFMNPEGFKPSFSFSNDRIISNKRLFKETRNEDALESALFKASMDNKTVIIAIVNKAYVEKRVHGLFLEGFWVGEDTQGLINHLLLVTVDRTSFERCKSLRLNCFKLETNGVDFKGEKVYMSQDFINMMWRRTFFLGEVLKRGYSFMFTMLRLRNPFHRLSNNESIDFHIRTDNFNGGPHSKTNPINTGFYMVRFNNNTISLFDAWYARKDSSNGMKEQDVLQKMINSESVFGELKLMVRLLDTLYFGGFCQDNEDFGSVMFVQTNCCRTIRAKVADLMVVICDWKRFKSSSSTSTTSTWKWSKHQACIHSWSRH